MMLGRKRRVKFGIDALDEMLGGGLLKGRVYILSGDTGAGKTLLAFRYLMEGMISEEDCLYIAVDKFPSAILNYIMLNFGWNMSNLHVMDAVPSHRLYTTAPSVHDITAKGAIVSASQIDEKSVERGELTVESIIIKISRQLQNVKYSRIVMDSLTTFKKFGTGDENERQAVQKLFRFLADTGATSIITVGNPYQMDLRAERVLASGHIHIHKKQVVERGIPRTERYIQVLKMRGSSYDPYPHRYLITKYGVTVEREKMPFEILTS